jgi:hypothetical protein
MARFNPKSFAQPDLLKAIRPNNLVHLLEPCRGFLEERGLSLPRDGESEIDHLKLSEVLATPDEWMDSRVIEGLHVIGNLGTDSNFDDLLDTARRNFIDVDIDSTAADLAARIWIEAPQALMLKEREVGAHRRRRFESFPARDPEAVLPPEALPKRFDELEADLEGWFAAKNRGIGCRVIRVDAPSEIRFLVQRGELCKREPSRKGRESTSTFFRPEKTDLVVYDWVNHELRINTSTVGEMRLYREKFGQYVFGDPEKFVYGSKYSLNPLKKRGVRSLYCRDVGGLEWIRLLEIEWSWPDLPEGSDRFKAPDVFHLLERKQRVIDVNAEIIRARFAVKLMGEPIPRPLVVQPPNIAEYFRGGEDAHIIEQWMRLREFALFGSVTEDEEFLPLLAIA